MKRAQVILPFLYVAFAIYAWLDFVRIKHDGLANVGLFFITLPVTLIVMLIGSLMGHQSMPMPNGFGYVGDHALYYVPAVAVTALLWWLLGRMIDRKLAR